VGAALLAGALAAAEEAPGRWLEGKVAAIGSERDYRLYIPSGYRGTPAPLVVMLHGCGQGADGFADSTRMNRVAEEAGFLVLYPAQALTANALKCWNWFLPENQRRDAGEPALIVAAVRQVERQFAVDGRRVYVAGLSAGASMAGILAACYPEVFAAAALHSGTMVKSAGTLTDAARVMAKGEAPAPESLAVDAWNCSGKSALPVAVTVWQGQDDKAVNRVNGDEVVRQFARLNDWADDGAANGSAPQPPLRSAGRVPGGHAWTLDRYAFRGQPLIDYYRVADMGHAWSGGKAGSVFADAKGPDASRLIWDFFRQRSR
jgi:poly(hydroxyalkanoate) depolymerase family esterase